MRSITTVKKNFQTPHEKALSAGITILRRVESFYNLGNVENRSGQGRRPVSGQTVKHLVTTCNNTQRGLRGEQ